MRDDDDNTKLTHMLAALHERRERRKLGEVTITPTAQMQIKDRLRQKIKIALDPNNLSSFAFNLNIEGIFKSDDWQNNKYLQEDLLIESLGLAIRAKDLQAIDFIIDNLKYLQMKKGFDFSSRFNAGIFGTVNEALRDIAKNDKTDPFLFLLYKSKLIPYKYFDTDNQVHLVSFAMHNQDAHAISVLLGFTKKEALYKLIKYKLSHHENGLDKALFSNPDFLRRLYKIDETDEGIKTGYLEKIGDLLKKRYPKEASFVAQILKLRMQIQTKEDDQRIAIIDEALVAGDFKFIDKLLSMQDIALNKIIEAALSRFIEMTIRHVEMKQSPDADAPSGMYVRHLLGVVERMTKMHSPTFTTNHASLIAAHLANNTLKVDDYPALIGILFNSNNIDSIEMDYVMSQAFINKNSAFIQEVRLRVNEYFTLENLRKLMDLSIDYDFLFSIPEFNVFLKDAPPKYNFKRDLYTPLLKDSPLVRRKLDSYCKNHNIKLPTQLGVLEDDAKRIGHVLGFKNVKKEEKDAVSFDFVFEGSSSYDSLKSLTDLIQQYPTSNPDYALIHAAFESSVNALTLHSKKIKSPEAAEQLLSNYEAGKLTFVSSGWKGHHVGITLYKDYLVVCNRGSHGDQRFGTKIYKIKDPKKITTDWILKINTAVNAAEFQNLLYTDILDYQACLIRFPTKGQKRGNCTFANSKSSIVAMLFLLAAEKQGGLEKMSSLAQEKLEKVCYEEYKRFGQHTREATVDNLLKEIKAQGTGSADHWTNWYIIIKTYLEQHQDEKKPAEIRRGKLLFEALPAAYQKQIREAIGKDTSKKFGLH